MIKKGELTTQQLVTIIVVIVSFAVILFLILRLGLGETTQKQICHNSVLMKAKVPLGSQLDCKTNYVCISGGGECDEFNEDYKVDIDMKGTDEIKKDIMKAIADEMTDCWWMFGEGKVDYGWLDGKYHCALCSIIKFDKQIIDKPVQMDYDGKSLLINDKYTVFMGVNPDLGKDKFIEAQLILSSDIGDKTKSGCEVFDLTKA